MNVIEELKGAHVVGITGHIRPDGDCTGSTLALYNYLKKNMPDMMFQYTLNSQERNSHILADIQI